MSEYSHSRAMAAARELFPTVESHGPDPTEAKTAKLARILLETQQWAAEIILKHMSMSESDDGVCPISFAWGLMAGAIIVSGWALAFCK